MYTEYRNEDQALIDKVDKEIDDLLGGLKSPEEITTVDTSNKDYKPSSSSSDKSELYSRSDAVLNLTYPAPSHYAVSQNFGHYRNGKAHTGIDFPCPTGSKIVAAQKGIVITVKRLNYSYGYYIMVYHGTDSRGRKSLRFMRTIRQFLSARVKPLKRVKLLHEAAQPATQPVRTAILK